MDKTRILVIDDFQSNLFCFENLFSNDKFKIYLATNGVEGIRMCEEIISDVIVARGK